MKRLCISGLVAALFVVTTGFHGLAGDCQFCACACQTGSLIASNTGTWDWGYWFYETKADGTPGAPADNAAANDFHDGQITCYNLPTADSNPNVTLQRYKVEPPKDHCTPKQTIKTGYNLKYPANAKVPVSGDGIYKDGPVDFVKRECNKSGG